MRNGSQTFPVPDREPNQRAVFSILPFSESGLTSTFPTKISKSERESGPNRRFIADGCSPGIKAGAGYISSESADPIILGGRMHLPQMGGERHQGLLAKVLGIESALVDGFRISRRRAPSESLVENLLNDRHRLDPQKGVELGPGRLVIGRSEERMQRRILTIDPAIDILAILLHLRLFHLRARVGRSAAFSRRFSSMQMMNRLCPVALETSVGLPQIVLAAAL